MIRYTVLAVLIFFVSCTVNRSSNTSYLPDVLRYGADPTGMSDSTKAFNDAIRNNRSSMVIIPQGVYRLDGSVDVKNHLYIESGTEIIRRRNSSNSTMPMFYLSTSYATLEGGNKSVRITSENDSPLGIVRVGHKDKSDRERNIFYCEVRNLTLTGNKQSSQAGNVGISLFNAQRKFETQTASYFHTINNLVIQFVQTGVHLEAFANANSLSNIVFNRAGNHPDHEAILVDGALENKIYDIFHHHSKDATTIRLTSYDGFGDRDSYAPMFNYIFGALAEQGGERAMCVDAESGRHNIIHINCNVYSGNRLFKDFGKNKNLMINKDAEVSSKQ